MNIYFYKSPLGYLKLVASDKGLCQSEYADKPGMNSKDQNPIIKKTIQQLDEYFAGKRKNFDIHFDLGGTDFQKKVWQELCKIPFDQTISYAELARRVGNPKASRAVGNANGKNPIPIIIPCHRVVKSDGSLGGYSSGITKKKQLLKLERD